MKAVFLTLSVIGSLSSMSFASSAVVCGLKGSLNARLSSCKKIAGRSSEYTPLVVSEDRLAEPLVISDDGDLDGSAKVRWRMVSSLKSGQQIWIKDKSNEYWVDSVNAYILPEAARKPDKKFLEGAKVKCASMKLAFDKKIRFSLPTESQWQTLIKQHAGKLYWNRASNGIALDANGHPFVVNGDAAEGTRLSTACMGTKGRR